MKKSQQTNFKHILYVCNKNGGTVHAKINLGTSLGDDEALKRFEVLQGLDTMLECADKNTNVYLSLEIDEDKNDIAFSMHHNLGVGFTDEQRKKEIKQNNEKWNLLLASRGDHSKSCNPQPQDKKIIEVKPKIDLVNIEKL